MLYNPNYLQAARLGPRDHVRVEDSAIAPTLTEFPQILSHGMQKLKMCSWNEAFLDASGQIGLYSNLPIPDSSQLLLPCSIYGWSRKIVALTLSYSVVWVIVHRQPIMCLGAQLNTRSYSETVVAKLDWTGYHGHITPWRFQRSFWQQEHFYLRPGAVNLPDVNIANLEHNSTVWLTSMAVASRYRRVRWLVIHKALDVLQDVEAADGRPRAHRVGLIAHFKSSRVTLPILHRCLRDAGTGATDKPDSSSIAQPLRTIGVGRLKGFIFSWLLATYSVAVRFLSSMSITRCPALTSSQSTRIFLNLKDLTLPVHNYNGVTWSEFQQNSTLELQLRSGCGSLDTHFDVFTAESATQRDKI
ncbi:hypothetical protein B0H13DRAFT_1892150 [Mycena leptocephala]|nr:hypothetical protein B0H13DRAFT_1892150 [Mycena leptocephala]